MATEKRNISRNKHKEPVLRERERERLYYSREERNPGSKQGREQEGLEREPWKGEAQCRVRC